MLIFKTKRKWILQIFFLIEYYENSFSCPNGNTASSGYICIEWLWLFCTVWFIGLDSPLQILHFTLYNKYIIMLCPLYEHSDLSELSDSEDSGLDPPLLFLPTAVRIIQLHWLTLYCITVYLHTMHQLLINVRCIVVYQGTMYHRLSTYNSLGCNASWFINVLFTSLCINVQLTLIAFWWVVQRSKNGAKLQICSGINPIKESMIAKQILQSKWDYTLSS